jgi:hypothetical protein
MLQRKERHRIIYSNFQTFGPQHDRMGFGEAELEPLSAWITRKPEVENPLCTVAVTILRLFPKAVVKWV